MNHVAPAAGSAALIAWGWNTAFPGMAMSAEVAIAAVVVLAPIFSYLTAFLPKPKDDEDLDSAIGFRISSTGPKRDDELDRAKK